MFSESHCHLRGLSDDNLAQVIKQAEKMGVELVLAAGIDLPSSEREILSAKKHLIMKACVGVHPWNADQYNENIRQKLKALAANAEVVAISEVGLDYVSRRNSEGKFIDEYVDKRIQRIAFREQLKLAKELDLPVLVHDRASDQEILDILEEEGSSETGVAIHGFSKDPAYAKRCISMGLYLSIGLRAISSPENEALREAVRQIPLEWLLTETDSDRPEGVLTVAEKIAELKHSTRDDIGRAATRNLRKLIGL